MPDQSVGEVAGHAQREFVDGREVDRDGVRRLVAAGALQAEEAALPLDAAGVGHQLAQHLEELADAGGGVLRLVADDPEEAVELRPDPGADAGDRATTGEVAEVGEHVGVRHRVDQRLHDDGRAERDALRVLREGCQAQVAVAARGPRALEAARLCLPHEADRLAGADLERCDPDLLDHRRLPLRGAPRAGRTIPGSVLLHPRGGTPPRGRLG